MIIYGDISIGSVIAISVTYKGLTPPVLRIGKVVKIDYDNNDVPWIELTYYNNAEKEFSAFPTSSLPKNAIYRVELANILEYYIYT